MQTVIRKIVKDNKMSTQAALIMMHNPIIKGWDNISQTYNRLEGAFKAIANKEIRISKSMKGIMQKACKC
ncbi:group II intron maturase-specific domain-containing protein [Orientia tsutsugamushi]|uniref:group II intron maturase-specific domain-containing protein n=1 Tax=Orientia tsutsugamushi TaxID=784 RepID=UPI0002E5EF14|nr:group II intron maturase-specific domain-containing protein [Orientia tsutsugamushi]